MNFLRLLWSFFWHADEWLQNRDDFRKWQEAEKDIEKTKGVIKGIEKRARTMWGD